jgi:GNAT superfamily N-acetyltransferase
VTATVRRAARSDRDALARLRRAWVEENAGAEVVDPGYEPAFAQWFEREHDQRVTWLALADDEPVGMLNVLVFTRMPRPGRLVSQWAYLANFFVLARHRGQGIGARLLATCVEHADTHDFVRVVLSPSERSVPLYRRAGFVAADDLMIRRSAAL